jgi:phosphoglucosamine mutase
LALFGTAGIRGLANRDLTAELALDVSVAAAHILVESSSNKDHQPTAIVGQDSRASGEFLEAAIVAGLVLGVLSLKSNSIWLGVAIHFSVAITMDFCSLWQKGYFS